MNTKKYAARRFATCRDDRRCFEVYEIATGECASFPGTRKESERYAKQKNQEQEVQS